MPKSTASTIKDENKHLLKKIKQMKTRVEELELKNKDAMSAHDFKCKLLEEYKISEKSYMNTCKIDSEIIRLQNITIEKFISII